MVQTHRMQHRRMKVVDVDFVFRGVVPVVIRRAVAKAALHSAASKPHGKTFGVVVAAVRCLGGGCAAELAAPPNERVVEHAALLQVG